MQANEDLTRRSMTEDQKPNTNLDAAEKDGRAPASLGSPVLFLISYTATGFAAGYFTGMSESPVVATLLPLLFGLIGSGGVILLVKADLSQSGSPGRVRVLATAGAVFALACMFGAVFGSSVRSGVGLENYLPTWKGRGPKTTEAMQKMPTQEAVSYFVLKTKLQALGASDEETKQILERTAQIDSQRRARDPKSLTIALTKIAEVREDLKKLVAIDPISVEETNFIREVKQATDETAFVERTLHYWMDSVTSATPVDEENPDSTYESITNFQQTLRDMNHGHVMVPFAKKANVAMSDFDEIQILLEDVHEPHDIYTDVFGQIDPLFDLLGKIKGQAEDSKRAPDVKK